MTSNLSRRHRSIRAIAVALVATAASVMVYGTAARAYSERVNQACNDDYFAYCGQHALGSSALRYCFEASRNKLSQRCINALVDAGEVPRKYLTEGKR